MIVKKIWVSLENNHLIIHLSNKTQLVSIADNYTGRLEKATWKIGSNKYNDIKIVGTYDFEKDIEL